LLGLAFFCFFALKERRIMFHSLFPTTDQTDLYGFLVSVHLP
jgi:hypothetical protein